MLLASLITDALGSGLGLNPSRTINNVKIQILRSGRSGDGGNMTVLPYFLTKLYFQSLMQNPVVRKLVHSSS